jgi:hypothetical protein
MTRPSERRMAGQAKALQDRATDLVRKSETAD